MCFKMSFKKNDGKRFHYSEKAFKTLPAFVTTVLVVAVEDVIFLQPRFSRSLLVIGLVRCKVRIQSLQV